MSGIDVFAIACLSFLVGFLCGKWAVIISALNHKQPLPAHPGCCDICDTGGCCKEESEEECSEK